MKIVNTTDTTHNISLIPRYYPDSVLTFTLTNEATKVVEVVANTYTIENGVFTLIFDYTFTDKDKFNIKLEENTIVYRGKLMVTDQETQEYKLTDNLYYYE